MTRSFDPISSADTATRDIGVDFSNELESSELIVSSDVVSSDVRLVISNVNHESEFTFGDDTVPAGKGVGFTITSTGDYHDDILITIAIIGDGGTADSYHFTQPVVKHL